MLIMCTNISLMILKYRYNNIGFFVSIIILQFYSKSFQIDMNTTNEHHELSVSAYMPQSKNISFVGIRRKSSHLFTVRHNIPYTIIRTHALAELKRHKIIVNVMPRPRQNNSVFHVRNRVRFHYFLFADRQRCGSVSYINC